MRRVLTAEEQARGRQVNRDRRRDADYSEAAKERAKADLAHQIDLAKREAATATIYRGRDSDIT